MLNSVEFRTADDRPPTQDECVSANRRPTTAQESIMAVNVRKLFPLEQARARRIELPHYLRLDGGRYLIAAALLLSLMSLLSLGQTGRLATKGYQLAQLQGEQKQLMRERSAILLRLSEAESLTSIEKRVRALNLRPMAPEQARYITIEGDAVGGTGATGSSAASSEQSAAGSGQAP
ncbi:MAG TPA: hypothetical protein VFX76_01765 [Roseiflexaceae bacterium]|nr:hypothetical protein [Roseiflexaceae bacterium]